MNPPAREFLEWQVADAELRFLSATAANVWPRAVCLIEAKFARGDYEMLQDLDEVTRTNLAKQLVAAHFAPPAK